MARRKVKREPLSFFILEQELDEQPSYCHECGAVHGPEACQYDDWETEEYGEKEWWED